MAITVKLERTYFGGEAEDAGEIELADLRELRAFYAAKPDDYTFASDYGASSCPVAVATNALHRADRLGVMVMPDPLGEGAVAIAGVSYGNGTEGALPQAINTLANRFDQQFFDEGGETVKTELTRDEILAIIDGVIAEYGEG